MSPGGGGRRGDGRRRLSDVRSRWFHAADPVRTICDDLCSQHEPVCRTIFCALPEGVGVGGNLGSSQPTTSFSARGFLVAYPMYGVRVVTKPDKGAWYPKLGDALKQHFSGWRACLLTAELRLPKLTGLTPSRRIPLFNGPAACRLDDFELVRGSMRAGKSRAWARAEGRGPRQQLLASNLCPPTSRLTYSAAGYSEGTVSPL